MRAGLSGILRAFVLLSGAMLSGPSPLFAQSGDLPPAFTPAADYPAWATVEIAIGDSLNDVDVRVNFERPYGNEPFFALVYFNTRHAPLFPDLRETYRAQIAQYEQLLTGDFELRPTPEEYWIGTRLAGDEARKTLRFNAPGFLARTSGMLESYELAVNDRQTYFEAQAPGAPRILVVPVIRYVVQGPSWGTIQFEEAASWLALGGNRFAFQPTREMTAIRAVVAQDVPGPGAWLQSKFAVAIAGFACSLLFFALLYDAIEPDRRTARWIPFVILLILSGITFIVAQPESSFARALFYDGAFFLGAMIPALVFAVLPVSWLFVLRRFLRQLRVPPAN